MQRTMLGDVLMSLYKEQNNPYFDIILATIFGAEFVLRVI